MKLEEQFYQKLSPAGKEPSARFHAEEGKTEFMPSHLLLPSRMEKCTYKGGTKIVPPRSFSRPGSHINSPWLSIAKCRFEKLKPILHFDINLIEKKDRNSSVSTQSERLSHCTKYEVFNMSKSAANCGFGHIYWKNS